MIDSLASSWDQFLIWVGIRSKPFKTIYQSELPDVIEKSTIYIVGEKKYYWCIVMLCPCGCNAIIQLNLLPRIHPRWSFFHNKNAAITIRPSIWRNTGCKSHFYVYKNRIIWCKETNEI